MDVKKNVIEFRHDSTTEETVIAGYCNEYAESILEVLAPFGVTKDGSITGNDSNYSKPMESSNKIKFYLDGSFIFYLVMDGLKLKMCIPAENMTSVDTTYILEPLSLNFMYYCTEETVLFHLFSGTDYGNNTSGYMNFIGTVKDLEDASYSERCFGWFYSGTYIKMWRKGVYTYCSLVSFSILNQPTQIIKFPFLVKGNYYLSEFWNMYIPISISQNEPNNVIGDMRVTSLNGNKMTYWVH